MGNIFYYQTVIGEIAIAEEKGKITDLYLDVNRIEPGEYIIKETAFLKEANRQLQEYFNGKRKMFSLKLNPCGTEFMKKVWLKLMDIPYGKTVSYKDIAKKIGNDLAYRAVGNANNKNPIPIFIPCHRVIGANNKLVGYGGGLDLKKYLLEIEEHNKV